MGSGAVVHAGELQVARIGVGGRAVVVSEETAGVDGRATVASGHGGGEKKGRERLATAGKRTKQSDGERWVRWMGVRRS